MEYLVTMTTHVPDGTSEAAVDDMRAREAARARELAAAGSLVRLWRPPLQPGEWRTLGLFAADDDEALEAVLSSMPLRAWRTDEPVALAPHPNDADPGSNPVTPSDREFLTTFDTHIPDDAPADEVADRRAAEARRARELAASGHLARLWRLGPARALGLWRARDAGELAAVLDALPLRPWMTVEVTPLTEHPSDPARRAA
jgi:muconolactone delta-isomerase